ncbi:peroxiredoxin [Thioalkalivibrio sp. XN279]|uniref:peroxiredoxin n=1 Tax=Thioalkalivibrio sp. XN279 TaxID=2714953 RepID=UPI00140AABAE|nr:peroxiredoxin [Thioalkalivibrio sp. XN279]NHA14343.1 peroxiredoxin [Thioalkalivibrio sp. XN279]
MLKAGDKAPDFTLPDQDGNQVSLHALLGDGPVVLYFYPADFTPGCTKEACSIRDMHDEIAAAGMRVVGVSPQDADSHARFRDKHGLPFTLVADPDKVAVQAYGVDGPLGIGVRRATFLIDPDGVIRDAVLADLRVGRHEEFIRAAVAAGGKSGG